MSSLAILAHLRFLGLMMIGAYALINAILALLSPITAGWPIWASTLLAVPPMVMGMVHLVLPIARRHLARPDGKRA
ncbi:uncharacterized protein (DUF983 family) [Xanthobacter sp. SG618]|uniref:hypothetical protein n=1 Tax=Xanthobacter sp. SG618 TaxID=2587121 RepID=UPI00145C972A|nr:hypothetical protein [Xanthobacter sp. SG618]NMN57523.1 uncharacterized protein (DUF983 family) [Xanthobacter sp. SG618]